jgi:hypothetical protein
MEIRLQQENDQDIAPPHEDRESRQFKGVRPRKWGIWVSEIRMPRSRQKIWLGSYKKPEQAARAYDAAVYCLRGPNAKFNFPNSVPDIPSASSLSRQQIQHAAAKYALDQSPSSPSSVNNNKEEPASPSHSSSTSETDLSRDKPRISEERQYMALWGSLFAASDGEPLPNLEKMPSIDDVSMLDLVRISQQQQEEGYILTDLWNFQDI